MAKAKNRATSKTTTAANLGFEAKLWAAADALRNNMDAAEYKHVVLGLIFLKYISDAFEAKHAELEAQRAEGADPEETRTTNSPGAILDARRAPAGCAAGMARISTAPPASSGCRRRRAGST